MSIVITNLLPRPYTICVATGKADPYVTTPHIYSVTLKSGVTILKKDEFEKIKGHILFKKMVDKGFLKISEGNVAKKNKDDERKVVEKKVEGKAGKKEG